MLRDERPSFSGPHYTVRDAINQPPPLSKVPVMIGGAGEQKTLRLVAQYADESNLTSPRDEIPRKLDVLAGHCERLGRDRSEITVSQQLNVCIAETHEQAYEDMVGFLGARGLDLSTMDPATRDQILALVVWGDPDEVGETLSAVLAAGVDGFTCSLPANGFVPGRVELLGRTASKVLG
jgi:alkanesulfonate monooxygenase SsuD/methylene tetrahydromethanopterin reductase-like flavin-dependent oxidoreductase (luciferase family)